MGEAERRWAQRLLLALALVGLVLAGKWAWTEPAAPNADRHEYAGRAWQLKESGQHRPFLVYPLRYAFPEVDPFPPRNMSRPPLWPTLMAPLSTTNLAGKQGILLSLICASGLLFLVAQVGQASFGAGAGGVAALALVGSFAFVRALWGGGPEIALAFLLMICWSWSPGVLGMSGYLACGFLYGLMPLLHPVGWGFALLALLARDHRYSRRGWFAVIGVGLLVALPWYLLTARWAGWSATPLQAQAEMARSLLDPGGIGPYRSLEGISGLGLLMDEPMLALRTMLSRVRTQLVHLDGWLAWPWILLALVGAGRDRQLFLRDAVLLVAGFLAIALMSSEWRLLVPLCAILALWAGAGMLRLQEARPAWPLLPAAVLLAILPWVMPMGKSLRPGQELAGMSLEEREPLAAAVAAVARAGDPTRPLVTDSAVLSFRARRPSLVLPNDPATLAQIAPRIGATHLALSRQPGTPHALAGPQWEEQLSRWIVEAELPGVRIYRMEEPPPPSGPPILPELDASDGPDTLVTLPSPPASREGIELHPVAWNALQKLLAAAAEAGLELRVVSGYRSHAYQARLYASAVKRHGPDQPWVAAPGRSEHQLGLAVDLADGALAHVTEISFGETPEGKWLAANVQRFGFRITYTPETVGDSGIRPEPWHIRFLEEENAP